jgi:hypothetical protein
MLTSRMKPTMLAVAAEAVGEIAAAAAENERVRKEAVPPKRSSPTPHSRIRVSRTQGVTAAGVGAVAVAARFVRSRTWHARMQPLRRRVWQKSRALLSMICSRACAVRSMLIRLR